MKKQTKTTRVSPTRSDAHSNVSPIDKFYDIMEELSELHYRKSLDYGTENDTYQNFRGAAKCGVPNWVGTFIRLMDKVQRIQKFARSGKLTNEGVIDSFNDLAVYAVICRILFEEITDVNGADSRKAGRKRV